MTNHRFACRLAVLAGAVVLSAPAIAQQPAGGWYLGGGIGQSKNKFSSSDFSLGIPAIIETKDESDTGYKLFGGYRFTKNWGVEGGYADLGKFSYSYSGPPAVGSAQANYEVRAWTLAGTGTFPISDAFSLQGRVGVAATKASVSIGSATGPIAAAIAAAGGANGSKSRANVLFGLGAQYDFGPRFGLRLDYDNYGKVGDADNSGRARVDMWSLNGVMRF